VNLVCPQIWQQCLLMCSNNQRIHQFVSVFYFTLLLLHVSATMCHSQGARLYLLSYMSIWVLVDKILNYKERKFSVSSYYIILLKLRVFMEELSSSYVKVTFKISFFVATTIWISKFPNSVQREQKLHTQQNGSKVQMKQTAWEKNV
jgi:hypothetical protein